MKPRHLGRFVCFFALSMTVLGAAQAKDIACVAARGHSSYKLESRCVNLKLAGRTRTYRVYVPPKAPKLPVPLLIVLHDSGGSGSAMEGMSLGRFNRIAEHRGIIVAYPDAIARSWNDGPLDRTQAAEESSDDVGFLRAMMQDIAHRFPLNPKRIYAAGISNGGLMVYRLACDAPDWIAAVAPVAANMTDQLASQCRPARVMPIAAFGGTDDPIMPWIGGEVNAQWNRRGAVLSAQESFEHWMKLGDCALPITHSPRNKNEADGTTVVRHVARECKDGAEIRLYEILGGGHTWPGGATHLSERVVGKTSHQIDAAEEIWNFLSRYSLP
jgi:polyhydroxybutyrate depolymerase